MLDVSEEQLQFSHAKQPKALEILFIAANQSHGFMPTLLFQETSPGSLVFVHRFHPPFAARKA